MEFVSGLPLADRVEQGPMPVDQVKVMLRRVASGLDKAHRAGVVHRDLSPDNVILEEDSVEHAKPVSYTHLDVYKRQHQLRYPGECPDQPVQHGGTA